MSYTYAQFQATQIKEKWTFSQNIIYHSNHTCAGLRV